MHKEQRKIVSREVEYVYERHIGELLAHLEPPLNMIEPNKYINFHAILREYNKLVGDSIEKFRVESCNALDSVLTKMKINKLSESERDDILRDLAVFLDAGLYEKRFSILISAIKRRVESYGISYIPDERALGDGAALSQCHALNSMRNIKSQYINIIQMRVHSDFQQSDKVLKLKPEYMGISIDLKALYKKIIRNLKSMHKK